MKTKEVENLLKLIPLFYAILFDWMLTGETMHIWCFQVITILMDSQKQSKPK